MSAGQAVSGEPGAAVPRRSPLRVLRFLPLALILLTAAVLLGLLLAGGMARLTAWYLLQILPPITGLIGLVYALIRSLVIRRIDRTAGLTALVGLLALTPLLLAFFPQPYPASLARTTPAATVRLPADVPLKVGWGGDRQETNYHVVAPDQRWAYDLLVEPYLTGSPDLTGYGCYGVPVLAPAAGLVTAAHDGEPDETPGQSSNNFTAPTGNHVFIQLDETGTFLVLAHLKQGSVLVQAGQRVEEGDPIGQCGNSGNTSEPHIHIHHQRQDPAVFPLNFAEGLPLYFRDHAGPPMPVGGLEVIDGTPVATGDEVRHVGP